MEVHGIMPKIRVINGPNLNLLGKREPGVYGSRTLADLETVLDREAAVLGMEVDFYQSNYEGDIIESIHESRETGIDALIINPGAFTHYSYAIRDAIAGTGQMVIEVHLSNVHAREEFRRHSVIAPVCLGQISGLGFDSYSAALHTLAKRISGTSS
jgi:3-dehydroquinate dehydratase II